MPPRVGGAGVGSDGAIGAGTGFSERFLAFALLAAFAFFSPFFLRTGAPRFAFLDFFATFNLRIGLTKIMQHGITPRPLILTCAQPSLIAAPPTDLPDRTYQEAVLKPKTTITI